MSTTYDYVPKSHIEELVICCYTLQHLLVARQVDEDRQGMLGYFLLSEQSVHLLSSLTMYIYFRLGNPLMRERRSQAYRMILDKKLQMLDRRKVLCFEYARVRY